LGALAECNGQTISNIEKGYVTPQGKTQKRIAKAFGLNVEELGALASKHPTPPKKNIKEKKDQEKQAIKALLAKVKAYAEERGSEEALLKWYGEKEVQERDTIYRNPRYDPGRMVVGTSKISGIESLPGQPSSEGDSD
jgi:transcriptional regulator with XRE-family HTH domain